MKVRPLLLLGDGRFAVESLEIAEAFGDFLPLGFVNSLTRPNPGATIEGLPVFWVDDLSFGPAECEVVCAIVTTERRLSSNSCGREVTRLPRWFIRFPMCPDVRMSDRDAS